MAGARAERGRVEAETAAMREAAAGRGTPAAQPPAEQTPAGPAADTLGASLRDGMLLTALARLSSSGLEGLGSRAAQGSAISADGFGSTIAPASGGGSAARAPHLNPSPMPPISARRPSSGRAAPTPGGDAFYTPGGDYALEGRGSGSGSRRGFGTGSSSSGGETAHALGRLLASAQVGP